MEQQMSMFEDYETYEYIVKIKYKIGQKFYMIPTASNGLKDIKQYSLLSVNLSDIGLRYDLSLNEKEKGVEPFYCASEEMFGNSIFTTKTEAEEKFLKLVKIV